MRIPLFQVDAFASQQFAGNPAAVCVLEAWPDDALLQAIAAENNLAETAFVSANPDGSYRLRWFTPSFEIPLCGHATLATGFVLFHHLGVERTPLRFHTRSGELLVYRDGDRLVMDFPAYAAEPATLTDRIVAGLGGRPTEFLRAGINYYAVFEDEAQVRALQPDYGLLIDLMRGSEMIGFVPTAPGRDYDFVSRYLAPEEGTTMTEDPVTGSIHCALVPLWADRLGKTTLHAYQASARGGELFCELIERDGMPRTLIGGSVQPYLEGVIEV
ncbi:MAG: PhzF family phenazine biosynthesis protein [Bacteroidota bacterium]